MTIYARKPYDWEVHADKKQKTNTSSNGIKPEQGMKTEPWVEMGPPQSWT
jgi:hypothetical protein